MTPDDLKLFALCVLGCSGASFAAVAIITWRSRNAALRAAALEKAWRKWAPDTHLPQPHEPRRHVSGRTK